MFFRVTHLPSSCCRHYPVDLRSPPLLQEGEYPSATFCERNIKKLGQNSPFLEGVDFFATAKKDGVVLGGDRRWFFKPHLFRVLIADTTPPAIAGTPSARRGISDHYLPTLTNTSFARHLFSQEKYKRKFWLILKLK